MTTHTLAALAERFSLTVVGDAALVISGICTLEPGVAGQLAFLANPQYRSALAHTEAAVIVGKRDAEVLKGSGLIAPDPYLAYARIARLFDPQQSFEPGIHSSAHIEPSASIGAGCRIAAGVVIEAGVVIGAASDIGPGCVIERGVRIGAGAQLAARVFIGANAVLGELVHVQPGAVIGSRGFGNARLPDGGWEEVPQLGSVLIGNDVEIGANTTIDRGALGNTVIGNGVKLDNQIQIAHNCVIGEHTAIAACTGIAGSTQIGRRCMIGGAAGIGGHLKICDDVMLHGMAMVTGHITEPGVYGSGLPLAPAGEWRKTVARVRRLDKMDARIKRLEAATKLPESDNQKNQRE